MCVAACTCREVPPCITALSPARHPAPAIGLQAIAPIGENGAISGINHPETPMDSTNLNYPHYPDCFATSPPTHPLSHCTCLIFPGGQSRTLPLVALLHFLVSPFYFLHLGKVVSVHRSVEVAAGTDVMKEYLRRTSIRRGNRRDDQFVPGVRQGRAVTESFGQSPPGDG